MKKCCVFTFDTFALFPQCGGNTRDLLRQSWQHNVHEEHNGLSGTTAVILPTECPRSVELLAGIC